MTLTRKERVAMVYKILPVARDAWVQYQGSAPDLVNVVSGVLASILALQGSNFGLSNMKDYTSADLPSDILTYDGTWFGSGSYLMYPSAPTHVSTGTDNCFVNLLGSTTTQMRNRENEKQRKSIQLDY